MFPAVPTRAGSGPQQSRRPRLLFCSYHGYLDPSSGAALSSRDLLALLTAHGWPCQVLCGPHLDFEEPPPLPQLLREHGLPCTAASVPGSPMPFTLYHFPLDGVPVTAFVPETTLRPEPSREEGIPFLAVLEQVLTTFRPDLMLTYGGHGLAREIIRRARTRGIRVVFWLHNFAYQALEPFRKVDAVLVPSAFAQEHYRRTLELSCTALPGPWDWNRGRCPEVQGQYVTFVNPQPDKGVFPFVRIATELWQRRPDIRLLVVEGRGRADWLRHTGHDLRGLRNLFRMRPTPDPRDFYQVSRAILLPSLCHESFGRVAAEALLNGIPVLASTRGALPETLGGAGFLFDIPERYTPASRLVPSAAEIAPWVETIIRLWDDATFHAEARTRCLEVARQWHPERLLPQFEDFLTACLGPSRSS